LMIVLVNRLSASQCLKPGWPSGSIIKISGEKSMRALPMYQLQCISSR
jgi:hypothetical protein